MTSIPTKPDQALLLVFTPELRLFLTKTDTGQWDVSSRANFPPEKSKGKMINGWPTPIPGDVENDIRPVFFGKSPDGELWVALAKEAWAGGETISLEALQSGDESLTARLQEALQLLMPRLVEVPYLNMGPNEYIFRFRTEQQRNVQVYSQDDTAKRLYQSNLCEAIKVLRRLKERTAGEPACLDFGPVSYFLPSHFGFCLGVQNAIERAYEALAENPGRRIFMLSELIHNPFVNEDLRRRGLLYLQTDKGAPICNPKTGMTWWKELNGEDLVIIPAFGATDQDKIRLIRKGIPITRYDATCMLVEKVWKAGRRFAEDGFTVLIHGKAEHEETKATFSNCAKFGPSIVIRNLQEARILGEVVLAEQPSEKERLFDPLRPFATANFDPGRDLEKIAVVNQTTLLRNETLRIIDLLEEIYLLRFGVATLSSHLHPKSRGDTLCYATQVNQDALQRTLRHQVDAALVVGGRNSSNTFQLFRLCEEKHGSKAHYIQSEENIIGPRCIRHYIFPIDPATQPYGRYEERPFLETALPPDSGEKIRLLITGGASCPDGIIQQVITRINGFFPKDLLRSSDQVLADLQAEGND